MSKYEYHYGGGNPPEPKKPDPPMDPIDRVVKEAKDNPSHFFLCLRKDAEWCARTLNGPPTGPSVAEWRRMLGIAQRLLVNAMQREQRR